MNLTPYLPVKDLLPDGESWNFKNKHASKDENSIDHHVPHVGVGVDLMLVWCRHNILRWGD